MKNKKNPVQSEVKVDPLVVTQLPSLRSKVVGVSDRRLRGMSEGEYAGFAETLKRVSFGRMDLYFTPEALTFFRDHLDAHQWTAEDYAERALKDAFLQDFEYRHLAGQSKRAADTPKKEWVDAALQQLQENTLKLEGLVDRIRRRGCRPTRPVPADKETPRSPSEGAHRNDFICSVVAAFRIAGIEVPLADAEAIYDRIRAGYRVHYRELLGEVDPEVQRRRDRSAAARKAWATRRMTAQLEERAAAVLAAYAAEAAGTAEKTKKRSRP